MRLAVAGVAAGGLIAMASVACAQSPDAADRALAAQTLRELQDQSTVLVRPGAAKTIILVTPVRASASSPGVCEYDVLEIERPGPWTPAEAPPIRSVSSERQYRLLAVQPSEAATPEAYARRDRRCREAAADREGFYGAPRAELVWIAGQLIDQAAKALGTPMFEALRPKSCTKAHACPSDSELGHLLTIGALGGVREEAPCPRKQLCLRALLGEHQGGDLALWSASFRAESAGWARWRPVALQFQRQPIISFADDVMDAPP